MMNIGMIINIALVRCGMTGLKEITKPRITVTIPTVRVTIHFVFEDF